MCEGCFDEEIRITEKLLSESDVRLRPPAVKEE